MVTLLLPTDILTLPGDPDIWVKPVLENARKVIQVLSEYGMGSVKINEEDLTQP